MQLVINLSGSLRYVYSEEIDVSSLGTATIHRASHVEPDEEGRWLADLSPLDGPRLGPFQFRSQALSAEQTWLEANWLCGRRG